MPVMTRAQKRLGATSLQQWWSGRSAKKHKRGAAEEGTQPKAVCNDVDPISLDRICDLQAEGRQVFLHQLPADVTHAYDAAQLFNYIETTGNDVSPLTRKPFSKADLQRLAAANGRHPDYLIAVRKFARWRAFMPSAMQAAASDLDCLWSYVELLVAIGADAQAARSLELCVILIFPWMFKCAESIRDAQAAGTGPRLSAVLPMFEARVRTLPPGAFRSGCESFLAQLSAGLPDK